MFVECPVDAKYTQDEILSATRVSSSAAVTRRGLTYKPLYDVRTSGI